jgi:hypothetical protein
MLPWVMSPADLARAASERARFRHFEVAGNWEAAKASRTKCPTLADLARVDRVYRARTRAYAQ